MKENLFFFLTVIFTDSYMVLCNQEKPKLDYIYFTRKIPSGEALKTLEKLSFYEPKVLNTRWIDMERNKATKYVPLLTCNYDIMRYVCQRLLLILHRHVFRYIVHFHEQRATENPLDGSIIAYIPIP